MARQKGFEPLTAGLEIRCSIQLSYWRFLMLSVLLFSIGNPSKKLPSCGAKTRFWAIFRRYFTAMLTMRFGTTTTRAMVLPSV